MEDGKNENEANHFFTLFTHSFIFILNETKLYVINPYNLALISLHSFYLKRNMNKIIFHIVTLIHRRRNKDVVIYLIYLRNR